MFVFIGKLSVSILRWVPMCLSFNHFSGFWKKIVLAKVATNSIRDHCFVKNVVCICYYNTTEYNMGIKQRITQYLKKRCYLTADKHIPVIYFLNNALLERYHLKGLPFIGCYKHKLIKHSYSILNYFSYKID